MTVNSHLQTITDEIGRAVTASTATVSRYTRHAAQRAAVTGSVRQILTLQTNTANRALGSFIDQLYDHEGRHWLSISMSDAQIKIPAPWSRTRHRDFGLTDTTHRILREWNWLHQERKPDARLWLFGGHRWYLNVRQYRTLDDAQKWFAQHKITLAQWVEADQVYQKSRVQNG